MSKIIVRHQGVPIAQISFDLELFENMKRHDAIREMASGNVSLEVEEADKVKFLEATLFACAIHELLRSEKVKCVLPNTSVTPG